jgi:hypothetical protein
MFGRPGFRIGSRTIKRGSRVSNLIVSFEESSNLCILVSYFLVLIWILSCEVLELVVIFTVIPSSSKIDFVWKTYYVFGVAGFTDLCLKIGQTFLHLILFSFVGLWCFYAWCCRACCGDSNEPKVIKNKVRMQKLLQFSYWCFLPDRIIRAGWGRIIWIIRPSNFC